MKYTKAEAEVVLFDNSDVITTSYFSCSTASAGDVFDACETSDLMVTACENGWIHK